LGFCFGSDAGGGPALVLADALAEVLGAGSGGSDILRQTLGSIVSAALGCVLGCALGWVLARGTAILRHAPGLDALSPHESAIDATADATKKRLRARMTSRADPSRGGRSFTRPG
jgi:hypothetical protein